MLFKRLSLTVISALNGPDKQLKCLEDVKYYRYLFITTKYLAFL